MEQRRRVLDGVGSVLAYVPAPTMKLEIRRRDDLIAGECLTSHEGCLKTSRTEDERVYPLAPKRSIIPRNNYDFVMLMGGSVEEIGRRLLWIRFRPRMWERAKFRAGGPLIERIGVVVRTLNSASDGEEGARCRLPCSGPIGCC